jgi:CubicO group peptidase (beta-lactamase class C family)
MPVALLGWGLTWMVACSAPGQQAYPALDALLDSYPSVGPGCAYVVRADSKKHAYRAAGMADPAIGLPLSIEQRMDVGSVGKSFTAAVILALSESGELSLESPVGHYLRDSPGWAADISLADLLYMRSGLPDFRVAADSASGWSDDHVRGTTLRTADSVSFARILNVISGLDALEFAPASRFGYSNSNYMLLRAISQDVGEGSFEEQLRRVARSIAEIDLATPVFVDGLRLAPSSVVGHDLADTGQAVPSEGHWDVLGASSVWVSVDSLARWGEALLADQSRFERHAGIGVARDPLGEVTRGYAAGLMVMVRDGESIVYHLGGTEGFSSGLFLRPEHGEVLTFSCNMSPQLFLSRGMSGAAANRFEKSRELVFLDAWLER